MRSDRRTQGYPCEASGGSLAGGGGAPLNDSGSVARKIDLSCWMMTSPQFLRRLRPGRGSVASTTTIHRLNRSKSQPLKHRTLCTFYVSAVPDFATHRRR